MLLEGVLKNLKIVLWSMKSYKLIFYSTIPSPSSQMAVKDLMIKYICANTASHIMVFWGLEIDRDSWICHVKRNGQVFLLNGSQILNPNYKKHLSKLPAYIPWILYEKISATTTLQKDLS